MAKKKKEAKPVIEFEAFGVFPIGEDGEEDDGGDYEDYVLFLNGKYVASFGSYYDSKGDDTAGGYMKGYADALKSDLEYTTGSLFVEDAYSTNQIKAAYKKLKEGK